MSRAEGEPGRVPGFQWPAARPGRDPATILVLTLKDGDVVEVQQREGRTGAQLAEILRKVADRFERGGMRRIGQPHQNVGFRAVGDAAPA